VYMVCVSEWKAAIKINFMNLKVSKHAIVLSSAVNKD